MVAQTEPGLVDDLPFKIFTGDTSQKNSGFLWFGKVSSHID